MNGNEPAFPVVGMTQRGDQQFTGVFDNGLTKREYAAIQAMQGMLANPEIWKDPAPATKTIDLAITFADALVDKLGAK